MTHNLKQRIADLEDLIDAATNSASAGGQSANFNLAQARKRLAELRALDADSHSRGLVRPRSARIKINNAW